MRIAEPAGFGRVGLRYMGMQRAAGVLAVIALVANLAPAQTPASGLQTIGIVVHDKHGKPLPTVESGGLQLQIDGHPATIGSFTSAAKVPLLLGVVVDTSKPQAEDIAQEKAPEKQFLDGYAGEGAHREFVMHFDQQIELLQDLTADPKLLDAAVEDLQPAADADSEPESDSQAERPRAGKERLYDAVFLAADEILRKPAGRKAIVVISRGIDHDSKESFAAAVEAAQRSGVAVYTVYLPGAAERPQGQRGQENPSGQQRRNGGIGWPGSPGGTGGGWPGGGGQSPRQEKRVPQEHQDGRKILLELAQKTGGAMFEAKKPADLAAIFKDIAEYLQDEYLLSFTAGPEVTGNFHRLQLTAAGGARVQAPQAFYTGN